MNEPAGHRPASIRRAIRSLGRAGHGLWAIAGRHPAAAIPAAVAALAALALAPDLFLAIPWPVRKGAGRLLFAGLVAAGLARLWSVRPGDDAPPRDDAPSPWWSPLAAWLACASLAVPILAHPENLGSGDWDLNMQKFESVRRSIAEWGQFPWWDPWCRGGFPLAANPQCGVVGVATPLVLAFGTSAGMRLAAIACLMIATEGARRLAQAWLQEPVAAIAAGLIYGLNGAVLLQTVAGYHLPMSYCAFPWLLHHAFRLGRAPAQGVWLGFWLAFNVLNGINYFSVYAVLILAVVWLRAARVCPGPSRARFLSHTALAIGVMLALAGWRLATTGLVYRDFPRPYTSGWAETPGAILRHLLTRPPAAMTRSEVPHFWETTCYVGPVVLALAALGLARGWRWWHTLAALCGALAAGTVAWYHPSYWLSDAPLFSSMHVATRWRVMAMLGIGLAAADVLARWRRGESRAWRWAATALVAAIAADYVQLGYRVLPEAARIAPEESRFPGPPTPEIVQVDQGGGFPAVLRGYGLIPMQEPLLGYNQRADTARTWRGLPTYRGEHWTDSGPIRPDFWSPNRIVLRAEPGQAIRVNQNPGSWWRANGRLAFPSWRSAETRRDFAAKADDRGLLVLEIHPRGLGLGLALHAAGVVLAILAASSYRLVPGPSRRAIPPPPPA